MTWPAEFFFPHRVQVRDQSGGAGMGPGYASARELIAEVKDVQQLVRTADGGQAVSSTTVTVPLDSAVAAGALVTVWRGTSAQRESTVIAVGREENPPPLASHLILSLK